MSHRVSARSHDCGELRLSHVEQEVRLCGWVDARRDHGGVSFIDLRDRYGVVQVVAGEGSPPEAHKALQDLRLEDCVALKGRVRKRDPDNVNPGRSTGEIEVLAAEVSLLASCKRLPFEIRDPLDAPEELRLKRRYLDLRRSSMRGFLELRSRANHAIRRALQELDFLEVETPVLTRSTPEGARDYLVPSRVRPGSWFALPQSPQIFKQLCMVAGLDRYFQFARCLRDEDLRSDRQPEFTQLDLEMSFVAEEDVFALVESVVQAAFQAAGREIPAVPFERLTHAQALARFASDKPDLRNPLEVVDLGESAGRLGFGVFDRSLESGGTARAIRIPGGGAFPRRQVETLDPLAREAGAGGVAWCRIGADGKPSGPLARFLAGDPGRAFLKQAGTAEGDLLVVVADRVRKALAALDAIRARAWEWMQPGPSGDRLLWVTEFPLFEENEEGSWSPAHHPFTSPVLEDLPALAAGRREGIRSRAYDLVWNGVELGSGSIRIHDRKVQEQVFAAIGLDPQEARRRFDFLLEAFDFGPPPHGGFAIGLDRLYALLAGASSIRDVIAFPKTSSAACPLTGAPTPVDPAQLSELGLAAHSPAPSVEQPLAGA
ncbi:MAG: aspartate--tRNA ligase [Planctomycetota bacterium]